MLANVTHQHSDGLLSAAQLICAYWHGPSTPIALQDDSPQSSSLQQHRPHGIVDAAQFADSMVPDDLSDTPQDPSSSSAQHAHRPNFLMAAATHQLQSPSAQHLSQEHAAVAWPTPPKASAKGAHMPAVAANAAPVASASAAVAAPSAAVAGPSAAVVDTAMAEGGHVSMGAPGSSPASLQRNETAQGLTAQGLTAQASSFANRAISAVTHFGRSDQVRFASCIGGIHTNLRACLLVATIVSNMDFVKYCTAGMGSPFQQLIS